MSDTVSKKAHPLALYMLGARYVFLLMIASQHEICAAQQIEAYNGSLVWTIPGAKMVLSSDSFDEAATRGGGVTTFASQSALDNVVGLMQTATAGLQSQFAGLQSQLTSQSARDDGLQTQVCVHAYLVLFQCQSQYVIDYVLLLLCLPLCDFRFSSELNNSVDIGSTNCEHHMCSRCCTNSNYTECYYDTAGTGTERQLFAYRPTQRSGSWIWAISDRLEPNLVATGSNSERQHTAPEST